MVNQLWKLLWFWIFLFIIFIVVLGLLCSIPLLEKQNTYKELISSIIGAFFGSFTAIAFASIQKNVEEEKKRQQSLLNLRRTFSEQKDSLQILREFLIESENFIRKIFLIDTAKGNETTKETSFWKILLRRMSTPWKCSSLINCDELSWMFVNDKNKADQATSVPLTI
jgi:hypothetical protein